MSPRVSNAVRTTRPTAVVTGAVDGLGAEVAVLLARRGYDLVLLNRSREQTRPLLDRLMTEAGDAAVEIVEVNLADEDSLVKAARNVVLHHPRIDVLFNNAGVLLDGHHVSRHHNELHFQVNALAPYMLMRLLRPALAAAPGGRVMNVSSRA